jgi:hypothetical protein
LIHPREVVDSLIQLKLSKLIRQYSLSVVPIDVPIGSFIVSKLVAKRLNCLLNDVVSAL